MHNADDWGRRDGLFSDDIRLVPVEEETRARAEQIREENLESLRHYVELLLWETLDNKDLRAIVISLLWHWEKMDPFWLAEGAFMSVADVRDIAESQPLMTFHCLDCGEALPIKGRQQLKRRQDSLEILCASEGTTDEPPVDLLCSACARQRADEAEEQRRLNDSRQQAMLAEYRRRPYAERRKTTEWSILKKRIHCRDKYRCRLCGDDEQLHVHHRTYTNYGEERLDDLITLCNSCHGRFHFPEAS